MKDNISLPLVAIWMLTYNHEKYIAEAIDGVVLQKTKFRFRLYIGEDCSTDKTGEICRIYRDRFPELIELITNTKNNLLQNTKNVYEACFNSGAKYIAMCEGDDRWNDLSKLQKQVDFLDNNPDYVIAFHDHVIWYDREPPSGPPSARERKNRTSFEIVRGAAMHTSTVMFRNNGGGLPPGFFQSKNGDTFLFAHLASAEGFGAAYLPDIEPSTYRMHSGGVWSKANEIDKKRYAMDTFFLIRKTVNKKYFRVIDYKITTIKFTIAQLYRKEGNYVSFLVNLGESFMYALWNLVFTRPAEY